MNTQTSSQSLSCACSSAFFARSGVLRGGLALAAVLSLGLASGCGRSSAPEQQVAPEGVAHSSAAPAQRAPAVSASPASAADGPARRLADIPFEYSWDLQFPVPVHASWISPATPDVVYFQLRNGKIHAVDTMSGKTKWETRALPRLVEHTPTVARVRLSSERRAEMGVTRTFDTRLYAIAGDFLFCFDAEYGQLIWRHDLGSSGGRGFLPSTSPVFQGSLGSQRIFIGDWAGRIHALTYDEETSTPYWLWQWNLRAVPLANPIAASDGLTYIADIEGRLHCFSTERDRRWTFDTVSRLTAPPLLRGRTAYLGSRANVLHVLNRLSGEEVARVVLPGPVTRQPIAFNNQSDRIFLWTGSGEQLALHSMRSLPDSVEFEDVDQFPLEVQRIQLQWSLPGVDQLVSSTPRHLLVTRQGSSDRILAVNRHTGVVDWHWSINADRAGGEGRMGRGGPVSHLVTYHDATDANRSIFTVDDKGYVVAYRLFGQF